jgi:hypothetical protein
VSSQLSWENRGNLYGEIRQIFSHSVWHEQQGRVGKKRTGAREGRLGEFWSMLEHFWSVLELEIEELGCQA